MSSKKIRPYQNRGMNDIFNAWDFHDIIMFVLATGGGKTFTFTEIIKQFMLQGKRAWLIAHREELISQSWQTLYDAKIMAGVVKADQPTSYNLPAQVMSIQTISRRKNLPPAPDLIVIDEGHHVTEDNTYGKILERYPEAKVLIVTATPYRLSGDGFRFLVKDKETKLIVNCTLKELIEDGWLVPLKYCVGSIPDMSGYELVAGDYKDEDAASAMKMAPIVESYLTHANGKQGICFCVNIEHSKEVCEKYNQAGIPAIHLDANTNKDVRRAILERFKKKEYLVVCNVGIFTEGTDFPNAEFVQLAAPTKSLSKFFQEVGRVTRPLTGILEGLDTAAERIAAIANSMKPYGIVLDNSGMWKEHQRFPDEHIEWEYYFNGWKQDKKKKNQEEEPEYIEIPVFIVEDPVTGARRRTNKIEEVDGMVLIEMTNEMRRNLKAMKHLQEFDRLYKIGLENSKVNKPGYFAYYKFREHCDSKGIEIEDIAWKYLRETLCDKIEMEINNYIEKAKELGRTVIPSMNSDIADIRTKGVLKFFLKKEWENYKAGTRMPLGHRIN